MSPRPSPRSPLRAPLAVALLLLSAACATTKVKVSRVWNEEGLAKDRYQKAMVVVVVPNAERRRTAEEHIVAELAREGRPAVFSWDVLPEEAAGDRERIAGIVAANGADAVLVVRLTKRETEIEEHAGRQEWVPVAVGLDYYGYVSTAYGLYRRPDTSELRVFTIETTLWDLASRRVVWACQSDSTTANQTLTTAELADDYARVVTKKVTPYLRGK